MDFKARAILYSTCIIVWLIRMLLKDINGILEVLVDVVVQGGLKDGQGVKRYTCVDTKLNENNDCFCIVRTHHFVRDSVTFT